MTNVIPRHVICVLGKWRDLEGINAVIQKTGTFELDRQFSQLSPDARMVSSFDASYDRVAPSMTENDWREVREHTAVAYVLSPQIHREHAADISGLALLLTAALLREGGVAAKGEAAGIAHGRARWLELAADFEHRDTWTQGASLFQAWVRRPLISPEEGVYYSCGMHLLGQRDIEIDSSLNVEAAIKWMELLGLYLVADRPTRPLNDGEGFRLADEGPRRIMRFRPCQRYDEDEFMFNPYGYIRLEADE